MRWLLWRQHRAQAAWTGAAFGLFAVTCAITGVAMAHKYTSAQHACQGAVYCNTLSHLFNGDGAIIDTVHLTVVLPLLLGVFLGAVVVARETEHATNVLAWSQSIPRAQWLRAKFAMVVLAAVVLSAAVATVVTWWSGTLNSIDGNRFQGAQFGTQNIAPIAYAIFGVALGLAAGAVFRRTLPAIATTVVGYVAVRLLIQVYAWPHYLATVKAAGPPDSGAAVPSGSWVVSTTLVDRSGHAVGGTIPVPAGCSRSLGRSIACLKQAGYHTITTFHPPSQYWTYQWIDVAVYTALAAALIAVAAILTLRHDA